MTEFSEKLGFDELENGAILLLRALLAEYIGNLLLNLFACGAAVNIADPAAPPNIVLIALAFGLAVFGIVACLGHISGGHLNPAVTSGMLATGQVKPLRGLLYIVAQCAGAATGSALLRALSTEQAIVGKLGVTALGGDITSLQGFGVEFFLGFILVFVVCGVVDPNKPDSKAIAPLAIGLTVTLGHLFAIDFTGASMNPARSFGSAVVVNSWADHWVYWAGPIAGGVAGALLYVHGFSAPTPKQYRAVATDGKEMQRLSLSKSRDMA